MAEPNMQALKAAATTSLSTRRVDVDERWKRALELKKQGHDYDYIAEECGYADADGAHKAVLRALRRWGTDAANDFRALELEKLDELWRIWYPIAKTGDAEATGICLQIIDKRAKLGGAYQSRSEVTHKGGPNNVAFIKIGGDRDDYIKGLQAYEDHVINGPVEEAEVVEEP